MFNDLKTDATIQSGGDNLGGSRFSALDSGLYLFTVKLAYGSESAGGAKALNLLLETDEGKELKSQLWLTSAKAKGGLNYYMAKDPKTGKADTKKYLPGFELANHLCLMTLGCEISQARVEKKTINLYDYSARQEVPTEVQMITDLLGKKVYAGVIKEIVNKRVKDPNTNEYVDSKETREQNDIDKFFHYPKGLTVTEAEAKQTEPAFKNRWVEKWTGQVKDRTSADAVDTSGFAGAGATAGTPAPPRNGASLFGGATAA